jgi:RND family efflux transporter MFP subunit
VSYLRAIGCFLSLALLTLASQAQVPDPITAGPLDCVLEPYAVVEVSSAVQGVIKNIYVDRNDMVEKGQLLVALDSNVEKTQVELARVRASLRTNIELREAELAFSLRQQERLEELYESDTISLHVKDEADTETRKARLQLRHARDNQLLAELELARAEAVLALRSMHSPISGIVVARNKVAGEFVEDQSILRVAQLNPLKVEVIAPVELFGSITEGMQVRVMPEHSKQGERLATITMVDRMIDPASGTFDVRAELSNPGLEIPSGLRCTVEFVDTPAAPEQRPTAVSSPSAAAHKCETLISIETTGYAVLADPAQNSTTSRDLVDKLQKKGVQDLYLLTHGRSRGHVSLGYYSRLNNAEKRQAEISNLGFVVSLDPRTREVETTECGMTEKLADSQGEGQ